MVRASKSNPLPNAPLELSDPVSLPEGDVVGAEMLAELGPEHAVLLFRVLRLAHAWAADGGASGWYDADVLRSLEEQVLTSGAGEHLRSAVAVLVGELADPAATDAGRLSLCCLQLSEWAKEEGAENTSLLFSRAAALVWPTNGALAYLAGRRYRSACRIKEADLWFRRAARVALWRADWETYAHVLTSLGTTAYRQGDYPRSRAYLNRALRVAERHGLRTLAGEIYHDRFTVAFISGEKHGAEAFAGAALERYPPTHPRLRALEYDLAYYWLTRGYAAKALDAMRALLPHFPEPEHRLQVVGASTRAAGALGDDAAFQELWATASALMSASSTCSILPAAVLDLGYGAGHLGRWEHAETAFQQAREISHVTEQPEDERLADAALVLVRRRENPDPLRYRFMQEKG